MKAGMALAAMLLCAGVAEAAPLKVRNGASVRVALAGKREMGVGLRPHGHGWELLLSSQLPVGAVADVFDVTEGAAGAKWTVEVSDGALFLDDETFIAGHAYRVVVRRGSESLGSALVYLYPPTVASHHKVTFDDVDTSAAPSDGIAIAKKPTL